MFRTDQATAVTALPVPAAVGTPGYFTGGNPATGQAATILDADWLNMVQEELMAGMWCRQKETRRSGLVVSVRGSATFADSARSR